jgi:hypothetical protein
MKRAKRQVPALTYGDAIAKEVKGFGVTGLLEYLKDRAVSELKIVEVSSGTYRLEALLTWKAGRSVLMSARGGHRNFRSVDTLVRFLKQMGVGKTVIRMELRR